MFRLLPLLMLTVGVVTSRRHNHHGNDDHKRPMITASQERRICADLCLSGLGGEPCGDVCYDLIPRGIPLQSIDDANTTTETEISVTKSRKDVCPVLCENHLGYPLCQCAKLPSVSAPVKKPKKFRVDFYKICEHYCVKQNWVLRGCPLCENQYAKQDGFVPIFKQNGGDNNFIYIAPNPYQNNNDDGEEIDWEKWCNEQCANSNGGSACNCDILPFSL